MMIMMERQMIKNQIKMEMEYQILKMQMTTTMELKMKTI